MTTDQQASHPPDAMRVLALPAPSPTLTVMREMTAQRESFTLKHEPMPSPPLPPAPPRVARQKRAYLIHSLTDLNRYLGGTYTSTSATETQGYDGLLALYTPEHVKVVLDARSEEEHEVITCQLVRHPSFARLCEGAGKPLGQKTFVAFIRSIRPLIEAVDQAAADYLIGVYSSLSGQLTHDSDEHLDMQARSVTFTVRRKGRGAATPHDRTIEDVPTQFDLKVPILLDDTEAKRVRVLVQMSGSEGAEIVFTLTIEGLTELVQDHVETRLQAFASETDFLCVRGEYRTEAWAQPRLPDAVKELLGLQTSMIAAMSGREE